MPTYVYKCSQCQSVYEKMEGINDEPDQRCVRCGAAAARRRPTVFSGMQLHGAGFYSNDYKGGSSQGENPSGCCPCGKNAGSCQS